MPAPQQPEPFSGTLIDPGDGPPPKQGTLLHGVKPPAADSEIAAFAPSLRPPMAFLTVCDDGDPNGEVLRLRADRFVIGRTEGDFLIPHDGLVSSRHVEIARQPHGSGYRWVVADLQSTNGLFIRVSRTVLVDGSEFLIGRGRYRFEAAEEMPLAQVRSSTVQWGAGAGPQATPSLVEVVAGGDGGRIRLTADAWVGTDATCLIRRAGDPFVEPKHARLSRTAEGRWQLQNNKSSNGVWLRVPHVVVQETCLFQIGEQRFRLHAPS